MGYLWRRTGAFVIDLSIISMLTQIIYVFIAPIVALTFSNIVVDFVKVVLYLFICVMISVGYNVICYRYFKYPLGKLLMNVKVLDSNGERISNKDYFIRESNKFVYIYATLGLYIPYQFFVKLTRKQESFHDKQVGTHVLI